MPDTLGGGFIMHENCCTYSYAGRGFLTKAEKIEMLKEYKEQLDNESQGVGERIKELQQAVAENH